MLLALAAWTPKTCSFKSRHLSDHSTETHPPVHERVFATYCIISPAGLIHLRLFFATANMASLSHPRTYLMVICRTKPRWTTGPDCLMTPGFTNTDSLTTFCLCLGRDTEEELIQQLRSVVFRTDLQTEVGTWTGSPNVF